MEKPPSITDTSQLRRFLLTQMDGVVAGKVELGHAKVVCNIAQSIYNMLRIEVSHAQAARQLGVKSLPPVEM